LPNVDVRLKAPLIRQPAGESQLTLEGHRRWSGASVQTVLPQFAVLMGLGRVVRSVATLCGSVSCQNDLAEKAAGLGPWPLGGNPVDLLCSLHFVGSALAVENVSGFLGAFALAPLRLFTAPDVSANLVAADNLLLGHCDDFFGHCQTP
jgi:hypothetical protein